MYRWIIIFVFLNSFICSAQEKLFFQQIDSKSKKCVWNLASIKSWQSKVLLSTDSQNCSNNIIFNIKSPEAYWIEEGKIKKVSFNKPQDIEILATVPPDIGKIEQFAMTKDGTFRVAVMTLIKETVSKDGKRFLVHNGKEYEASLKPIGEDYLIFIYDISGDKFIEKQVLVTESGAEGTSGIRVANSHMITEEPYQTIESLVAAGYALNKGKKEIKEYERSDEQVSMLLGKAKKDTDSFAYIPLRKDKGIWVSIFYGHGPHYTNPLFFCRETCKKPKVLNGINHSQLNVTAAQTGHVLVAYEYGSYDIKIFRRGNPNAVYENKSAKNAFWINFKWLETIK